MGCSFCSKITREGLISEKAVVKASVLMAEPTTPITKKDISADKPYVLIFRLARIRLGRKITERTRCSVKTIVSGLSEARSG